MISRIQQAAQVIRNHAGFRRYAANTTWMFAEQILRIVAGLFIGLWVARYLRPEKFGLLSYVQAFVAIFGGIAQLGLDSILVRELIRQPDRRETYLGTAFWLKTMGAMAVLTLIGCILPFTLSDSATSQYIFIAAAGLVFQSFDVIGNYFQSKVLAKVVSICKIIQLALSSVLKIYLILTESELLWFVLIAVFDAISLAASYIASYIIAGRPSFIRKFDIYIARQLLKSSLPLMFGGLSFTIFSNIDAIMIKEMMGEAAVGTYAAAYRLTVVWHFLPGLLLSSLMPALVQSKNEPQRYQQRKQMVTSILIWFAIGLALFTSLTAGTIIKLTYGNAYSESASLLTLLMWVNVIIFFNSCWNHFSIINNNSRSVFYFHLSTATANIALNIILIPIYGLRGAAYAILASLAFSLTIFSVIDKTTLPLILSSLTLGRLNFDK